MSPENTAWAKQGWLFHKLLHGEDFSEADLERANRGLTSSELAIQVDCCAVLCVKRGVELDHRLVQAISKLRSLTGKDALMKANVLLGLSRWPMEWLRESDEIRAFILEAAAHKEVSSNAATIIGRLAAAGDDASKQTMEHLLQSAESSARTNVQLAYDKEREGRF